MESLVYGGIAEVWCWAMRVMVAQYQEEDGGGAHCGAI